MVSKNEFLMVMPSRSRVQLAKRAAVLFSKCPYTICVAESEKEVYVLGGCGNVTTHPDDISGVGKIRQWVLDNFSENVIVMADDDVSHAWCSMYRSGFAITEPTAVFEILANAANVTLDLGLHVFGFSQSWDVRKYNATKPLNLCGWVGGG